MRIFLHRGSRTDGPYTIADVRRLLHAGCASLSDLASYDGRTNLTPLSLVPGVTAAVTNASSGAAPAFRLGCSSWGVIAVALIFVLGLISHFAGGDDDSSTATSNTSSAHRALSPREFGLGLGRELLRHAESDGGSGGMVVFAQSCRAENPTVKTYSNAEYQQFLNGLIDAYVEWRRNGYVVPGRSVLDQ